MEPDELNWSKLWLEKKATSFDTNQFIEQITFIEKQAKADRIKLTIGVPIVIVVLSFLFPILENNYYLVSIIFIFLGMLMILVQNYKNKSPLLNGNTHFNNKDFINIQITKLKKRLTTASTCLWISAILLIIGFNVLCLQAFEDMPLTFRIVFHLLYIITIPFLIRQRMKRYNKQILPLIDKLENLELH